MPRKLGLFEYHIGGGKQWDRQSERFDRAHIDDEFKLDWQLHGKVSRLRASEYPINVIGRTAAAAWAAAAWAAVAVGSVAFRRWATSAAAAGSQTGGGVPYGSDVGPGSGEGAGASAPGAPGGGGAPGKPTAAGGNAWIAAQRAGFAKELQDPNVRMQVAAMLHSEDPGAGPAAVESLMNRAAFAHKWLAQMLHSGFYGPINRGQLPSHIAALQRNPKLAAQMNAYIDQALAGSDVIKGHTDQGGPGDPSYAWERAHGGVLIGHQIYGDWLRGRGTAAWREAFERGALESAVAERNAIDQRAVQTTKVDATDKLTADIKVPRGTTVDVEGGGVFKNIEVNRQTQMEAARNGPPIRD